MQSNLHNHLQIFAIFPFIKTNFETIMANFWQILVYNPLNSIIDKERIDCIYFLFRELDHFFIWIWRQMLKYMSDFKHEILYRLMQEHVIIGGNVSIIIWIWAKQRLSFHLFFFLLNILSTWRKSLPSIQTWIRLPPDMDRLYPIAETEHLPIKIWSMYIYSVDALLFLGDLQG